MRYWAGIVTSDQYASQRLYAHDAVSIDAAGCEPEVGDSVALLTPDQPSALFGLGTVRRWLGAGATGPVLDPDGAVMVAYTHRLLDNPLPVFVEGSGMFEIGPEKYEQLASQVGADRRVDADRSEWFVSVALPIEASSRAEAVREFWSYVEKLGPRELPAYVWPKGDELSMQAYVLGVETNLDPEEDED